MRTCLHRTKYTDVALQSKESTGCTDTFDQQQGTKRACPESGAAIGIHQHSEDNLTLSYCNDLAIFGAY
jgi:hypothetical protein